MEKPVKFEFAFLTIVLTIFFYNKQGNWEETQKE